LELVTQEELGSVLELLNSIIPILPNKKIVAWCGTISMAKRWKELFESNYKQRVNLKDFTFGLDTSQIIKRDKNEDGIYVDNDYDKFRISSGKSILFCANKHREGSDINLLDCCMFLDKVKDRGAIPFIQSIGRVLRLPKETENKDKPNKTKGVIIDGYVKENNNYDKEFIKKLIGYYIALQNLTGLETSDDDNKSTAFIKALDVINFDKSTQEIKFKLGTEEIKIHCNKLEWNNISKHFEKFLQQKIKLSNDEKFKLVIEKLKKTNKFTIDCDFWNIYDSLDKSIFSTREEFYNEYKEIFDKHTWFEILGYDMSCYYKSITECQYAITKIKEVNNIDKITNKNYLLLRQIDNKLPPNPEEYFKKYNFKDINKEFNYCKKDKNINFL
jgi:hypothetical protein